MVYPKITFHSLAENINLRGQGPNDDKRVFFWLLFLFCLAVILCLTFSTSAFADSTRIPGTDASDQLQAAGTLLRIIDTGLFKWGARIFAGICIMSSGWALKEQRFGIAIICVIGAIIFGTAPTWVKNIFDIGGGGGVFSQIEITAKANQLTCVPKKPWSKHHV